MKGSYGLLILALLPAATAIAQTAAQPEQNDLEFLEEEARVVTPARRPTELKRAPATTYVVTAQDIKTSGAVNIWDVLRQVPGVDVVGVRAFQGEVGIRGLDKIGNNRVLILLDGKTVLNGYFDSLTWESIPVTLDEIDRIEIVEGPASALYGANALSGVINIVTKKPDQIAGAQARYSYGERATNIGSLLLGGSSGPLSSKLDLGWRSGNRFDDAGRLSSQSQIADGLLQWDFDNGTQLGLSGGLVNHDAQVRGPPEASFDKGQTGYLRLDAMRGRTKARFFWNAGRSSLTDLPLLNNPTFDYDTFDLSAEQGLDLAETDNLTVGASARRNTARSNIFQQGPVSQDLFAVFFDNEWRLADDWSFVASGRFDHHPFTGWVFSPRGSLLYYATPSQTLRFSAGEAFRNPTLVENYIQARTQPSFLPQVFQLVGATSLRSERIRSFEVQHRGDFGSARTILTGFQYTLTNQISGTDTTLLSAGPPQVFNVTAVNRGATRALGGEAAVEADLSQKLTVYANYSYQSLADEQGFQLTAVSAPKHKANAGARYRYGGWTFNLWENWVDHTLWSLNAAQTGAVPAYGLLNAYAGYRFSGRLAGLELAVSAFNALDEKHFEILGFQDAADPGQGGAAMRSRWLGTASYRFR